MLKITKPGDFYLDENGNIHKLLSYCDEPTATMENVAEGFQTGGGIHSLNLSSFTPLGDISDIEALKKTLATLAVHSQIIRDENLEIKEKYNQLKSELITLKYEKIL